MSTDFPELVHVNGWQKRWKGLLNSSWGPYEKVYTPLNDHERCIFTTCWSGLEKFFCWASNFKRLLARWVRVQASHHPIAIKSLKTLTVISIKISPCNNYLCSVRQSGHENYGHGHTRWIWLIFYQLLPTTSVGNEWGQQMRIQILIFGFKGLTKTRKWLPQACKMWELLTQRKCLNLFFIFYFFKPRWYNIQLYFKPLHSSISDYTCSY